jgi:hypothetical protein
MGELARVHPFFRFRTQQPNTMKKMSLAVAALLAAAGFSTSMAGPGAGLVVSESGNTINQQPATKVKSAAKDTKINRLGLTGAWTVGSNVGKRYRATVAQHRRNATKARNTQRHRKANRG